MSGQSTGSTLAASTELKRDERELAYRESKIPPAIAKLRKIIGKGRPTGLQPTIDFDRDSLPEGLSPGLTALGTARVAERIIHVAVTKLDKTVFSLNGINHPDDRWHVSREFSNHATWLNALAHHERDVLDPTRTT